MANWMEEMAREKEEIEAEMKGKENGEEINDWIGLIRKDRKGRKKGKGGKGIEGKGDGKNGQRMGRMDEDDGQIGDRKGVERGGG